MKIHRFILLAALVLFAALASAQEVEEGDKCLDEKYAEANCARPCYAERASFDCCAPHSRPLVLADGTCCAQGGYKLPGHG